MLRFHEKNLLHQFLTGKMKANKKWTKNLKTDSVHSGKETPLLHRTKLLILLLVLWQYGLWSYQEGGTKLEKILAKNQQHTQRKLLNFENWVNGGLRSFQKSEFWKSIIFIFPEKKYLKLKSWLDFNATIVFY